MLWFLKFDYCFTTWSKLAQEWLISCSVFKTAEEASSFLFCIKDRPLFSMLSNSFSFVLIDSSNSLKEKRWHLRIFFFFLYLGRQWLGTKKILICSSVCAILKVGKTHTHTLLFVCFCSRENHNSSAISLNILRSL